MAYLEWGDVVDTITPHVVRIMTPQGSGTGFLVTRAADGSACGIATAAHVINHAHFWEQPIRIEHIASGKTLLLRSTDRAIFTHPTKDTAGIVFNPLDIPFPDK